MKRPIVLIDGMNQLFRAHFAHAALSTQDGFPTGAIFGFLETILTIQRYFSIHPDIVICWEGDTVTGAMGQPVLQSWRKELARTMYKANRQPNEETPRALSQLPKICALFKAMGFLQVQVPQLEADDVIGVAAATLRYDTSAGTVYIFSGDQDFYQCIDGERVQVLHPKAGKFVRVDERTVLNQFEVSIKDWAEFKALAGDSTDNYKALKGVGPKGAAKLLKAGVTPSLSSFDKLPQAVKMAHPQLQEHWEALHLCYRLARIPTSWSHSEFPAASQKILREVLRQIVLRRRRQMTEPETKQAFADVTKMLMELEMQTFLVQRPLFFHGVRVLRLDK